MPQIIFINIAKAIGIILVVAGHFHPDYSPAWYDAVHDAIYSFHMPLFMFASGYVYIATLRQVSYKRFVGKKIMRLLLPYWSVSVLVVTMKLLGERTSMQVDHPVTAFSYAEILYSPVAGAFLWFVLALFLMFAVIPFFTTPRSRLYLFAFSLVMKYVPMFVPLSYTEFFCIHKFFEMLPFFLVGILVFDYRRQLNFMSHIHSGFIYALFIAGCAAVVIMPENVAVKIITPYLGIAAIVKFSLYLEQKHSVAPVSALLTVGAASYTIYLWHTTFQGISKSSIRLFFGEPEGLTFCIAALIVIAIGVVGPWLLHRYIFPRWRITRLLFGIKNPKK